MVYTKRNNYDHYDCDCLCTTKRIRKVRKIRDPDDEEFCKRLLKGSVSTESLSKRGSRRGLQRSRRSLNYSTYSLNDSLLRAGGKGHKPPFDSADIDFLNIPETDRRILEILALKKEQEIEGERLAYRSQIVWEKSQNERIKAENERKERWQKYVKNKRRSDSLQNLFRMEDIKQSLRESQKDLEDSLRKRDENTASRKKQCEEKKQSELKMKQSEASLKRAITEANYKHKEQEVEDFFQRHIEELEEKLNRAESQRRHKLQQSHRRVASANRSEDLRHQENMLGLLEETSVVQRSKQRQCRERESRATQRQVHHQHRRARSLRQMIEEQEERAAQVREMHRELTRGLEAWQDQVLLLQWADHQRAEAAVTSQREHRRLKVKIENKERTMLHQQRLNRVREAEKIKQESAREAIYAKEEKMKILQEKRDRELLEGRAQAQMTAELRDHLRRTLSPETFDQKVARAALETRISSYPPTASPSIMSSHIRLG